MKNIVFSPFINIRDWTSDTLWEHKHKHIHTHNHRDRNTKRGEQEAGLTGCFLQNAETGPWRIDDKNDGKDFFYKTCFRRTEPWSLNIYRASYVLPYIYIFLYVIDTMWFMVCMVSERSIYIYIQHPVPCFFLIPMPTLYTIYIIYCWQNTFDGLACIQAHLKLNDQTMCALLKCPAKASPHKHTHTHTCGW